MDDCKNKKSEVKSRVARDIRPKGDGPSTAVKSDHQHPRVQPTDYSYVSNMTRETGDGKRKLRGLTHASSSLEKGFIFESNMAPLLKPSTSSFGFGNVTVMQLLP